WLSLRPGQSAARTITSRSHCQLANNLMILTAALSRLHSRFHLLWDEVQDKSDLFIDYLVQAVGRRDPVRILAAAIQTEYEDLWNRMTPTDCQKLNIASRPLLLRPFNPQQAHQMAQTVNTMLGLQLDSECLRAYADHIVMADGGPLFALSTGQMLAEQISSGQPITIADVQCLPQQLLETWRKLYGKLQRRDYKYLLQDVLQVLLFLHTIGLPFTWRLAEILYVNALGHSKREFCAACKELERSGWLECRDNELSIHLLTLTAVEEDSTLFPMFEDFARQDVAKYELEMGRLREALARYYAGDIQKRDEAYK
ncbi:MAG: hypothetical protein JXA93_07280, partial [Anaerolineae bacterium]|nr:hypothetical protein [Anaerolineae bacterium]